MPPASYACEGKATAGAMAAMFARILLGSSTFDTLRRLFRAIGAMEEIAALRVGIARSAIGQDSRTEGDPLAKIRRGLQNEPLACGARKHELELSIAQPLRRTQQ